MKYKLTYFTFCFFFLIWFSISLLEEQAYSELTYQPMELTSLLSQSTYSKSDFEILFRQTGLSPVAILQLKEESTFEESMLSFQKAFFQPLNINCETNSVISREERISPENTANRRLAPLLLGDIFLSNASHTTYFRNGHAGLYVDEEASQTLEAVVLGQPSILQPASRWLSYSNMLVLRLNGYESTVGEMAADHALTYLANVPYDFTVGILSAKEKAPEDIRGTQCAHLVWAAYQLLHIDLDGNDGPIVIPDDILHSSHLQVVQMYGMDPDDFAIVSAPAPSSTPYILIYLGNKTIQ